MIGRRASTFLSGIGTDPQALEALDQAAARGQDHTVELLHYKRNGSAFCDQVRSLRCIGHSWHLTYFMYCMFMLNQASGAVCPEAWSSGLQF